MTEPKLNLGETLIQSFRSSKKEHLGPVEIKKLILSLRSIEENELAELAKNDKLETLRETLGAVLEQTEPLHFQGDEELREELESAIKRLIDLINKRAASV